MPAASTRQRLLAEPCHFQLAGCTQVSTTLDHIVPQAIGGRNALVNLVGTCYTCNQTKGCKQWPEHCERCTEAFKEAGIAPVITTKVQTTAGLLSPEEFRAWALAKPDTEPKDCAKYPYTWSGLSVALCVQLEHIKREPSDVLARVRFVNAGGDRALLPPLPLDRPARWYDVQVRC